MKKIIIAAFLSLIGISSNADAQYMLIPYGVVVEPEITVEMDGIVPYLHCDGDYYAANYTTTGKTFTVCMYYSTRDRTTGLWRTDLVRTKTFTVAPFSGFWGSFDDEPLELNILPEWDVYIVQMRAYHGPFGDFSELLNVNVDIYYN